MAQLFFAVFCMIIVAIATAFNAWVVSPVVNDIFVAKNVNMLYIIPMVVIANSLIKGIASYYEVTTMRIVGQRIVNAMQLKLYSHLIYADTDFHDENSTGNFISRFTNDINTVKQGCTDFMTSLVKEVITLLGLIGLMFYQSVQLALIVLIVVPLIFYPIRILAKRMRKVAKNMQEQLGHITVHLDETFQNINTIKSYCREEYEISRANKVIHKFLEFFKKASKIEGISSPIMEAFGGIAIAIVIIYGGNQVMNGSTTAGAFISFMTALLLAYRPLKQVTRLNTTLQEAVVAAKRLFNILDYKPKIFDSPRQKIKNIERFNIEFKNVTFSYKGQTNIFGSLNIKIKHGQTVALVGSSGSGKSTVLRLLQRHDDPKKGEIIIDGHSLKDIKLSYLRNSIAHVSQEVSLFDDTILENIRYGRLDATNDEIISAAKVAAAHEFIMDLPNGYKSKIGQKGVRISGGQRQRIAIARAILKDAPLLLLDEATSALDAISEKKVQKALDYLKKGRTTIVIAHRLSTIESADLIYYISEGTVKEHGTHKELLNKNGDYAHLYEKFIN